MIFFVVYNLNVSYFMHNSLYNFGTDVVQFRHPEVLLFVTYGILPCFTLFNICANLLDLKWHTFANLPYMFCTNLRLVLHEKQISRYIPIVVSLFISILYVCFLPVSFTLTKYVNILHKVGFLSRKIHYRSNTNAQFLI